MELKQIMKSRLLELQLDYESATAMANRIGIPRQTLDKYLHGERTPTFEILYKICDRCDISADWLLGLSDVRNTNTDIKAACKTTGLSELTVSILHENKRLNQSKPALAIDILTKRPILLLAIAEYFRTSYEMIRFELPDHETIDVPVSNAVFPDSPFLSTAFTSFEPYAILSIMNMLKEAREEEMEDIKNGKS